MSRPTPFTLPGLLAAVLLSLWALNAEAAAPQPQTVQVGGQTRSYLLAAPAASPAGPRPLVLVLHGHFGSAANALGEGRRPSPLSAWLAIADREGVLVAALQGVDGRDGHSGWNDCRGDATGTPQVDDVTFAEAVVATLVRQGRADPHRVYVMGMSNGAMMSLRLALQMRPAPAAIAAVSGTLAARSVCGPAQHPVSVLLIDGTADPIVPYAGGAVGGNRHPTGTVTGAEATKDFWLAADHLAGRPAVTTQYAHHAASGDTTASRRTWGDDAGPQVALITVQGGGHIEPSLREHYGPLYRRLVGAQNQDFESAEEAWTFFRDKRTP